MHALIVQIDDRKSFCYLQAASVIISDRILRGIKNSVQVLQMSRHIRSNMASATPPIQ
jgi:hypothetical protein